MNGALLSLAFGCIIALVAVPVRAEKWGGVPVLMYHRIDAVLPPDAVGRDLTIDPRVFEAQLRYLRAQRITPITAQDLARDLERGRRPQRAVVLTFDDGYADAATVAGPLLERYGFRATFYISSGLVGTPHHVSWQQLRALRGAGMEVACHGTKHLDLSTLDLSGQMREAGGCMRRFARYLGGASPITYAYPAGKYDATTLRIMRALGIQAAFTERPGAVTGLERPYELPRRRVRRDDSIDGFAALTTP